MPATAIERNLIGKNTAKYSGLALVFVPVTILLHELGHFLAAVFFRFPDLVLHYASVSHTAADHNYPFWQLAVQAAAGPLVTIIITLFSCYYVARHGANIAVISAGIVAPIRFLIGAVYLFWATIIFVMGGTMGDSNFDEFNVAKFSSIPITLLLGLETLIMLWAWWFLGRQIQQKGRLVALLSMLAGIITGTLLWLNLLGPQLIP